MSNSGYTGQRAVVEVLLEDVNERVKEQEPKTSEK